MMNLITVVVILSTPALCLGYLIYRVRQLTYLEACFHATYRPSSSIEVPLAFHDAFQDVEVIEP